MRQGNAKRVMKSHKKTDFAKKLIEAAAVAAIKEGGKLEVAYSGGKDSDVLLFLTKEVLGKDDDFRVIYKNTTIDPRGTISHAREVGAEVIQPRRSFKAIIEAIGYPSRWARFCCSELKEYVMEKHVLMGVRSSESVKRSNYAPQECRVKGKQMAYYPLLYFTDDDIASYVDRIQFHPLYYDEEGRFHPERRLGCMGCPLATLRCRLKAFRENSALLRLWLRAGDVYIRNKPNSPIAAREKDAYSMFLSNLLSSGEWRNSLFGETAEDILIGYFGDEIYF